MSHKVSYKWFRRTQYITPIGLFYKNRGRLWRVSDYEELVGVFRNVPLPYPIYTPFLQVRVDSIVSALLALVK